MLEHLFTLVMLIALQLVLGFDNLLYISLVSKRAPEDQRGYARKLGIGLAIVLRIVLLVTLVNLIKLFEDPWFGIHWKGVLEGDFSGHALIVLAGGGFIIYTATKEISHMMSLEEVEHAEAKPASLNKVIGLIVLMNLVFSFDSILSAMALTENIWVMSIAIVIGGVLMIALADTVSSFLAKNRMYEVLGLFILFLVGVMLVSEAGHKAHMKLFGGEITEMSKATFYFVLIVLVLVDIVQSRYQRKLNLLKQAKAEAANMKAGAAEAAGTPAAS